MMKTLNKKCFNQLVARFFLYNKFLFFTKLKKNKKIITNFSLPWQKFVFSKNSDEIQP